MNEAVDQSGVVLANLPAGPTERRIALVVGLALLGIGGLIVPFGTVQLPVSDTWVPIAESFMIVADFLTWLLLISQFEIVRTSALLVLASGYLFSAAINVPILLTFPGVFSPTGVLHADFQSPLWLGLSRLAGYSLATIFYAVMKKEPRAPELRGTSRTAVAASVAIVIAIVLALTWITTAGVSHLPIILRARGESSAKFLYVVTPLTLLTAATLPLLWLRRRTVLDLWLMVATCAWLAQEAVKFIHYSTRNSLSFYSSTGLLVISSTVLLVVLLKETMTLYGRLAASLVTVRRLSAERLQRSEAYLSEAQALSHTGSFGWSPSREEIHWSEETFKIFEYERTVKPTLQLVLQRMHPEDRDLVQQELDRAARARSGFDLEHRLLMPDGSIKHLHVLARALETSPGNLEFVGALTDITAAKLTEEALRASENNLRRMVDSVPGLQFALSSTGKFELANRPHLEYFGKTIEEIDRWSTNDAIHPDDLQRVINGFTISMANGTPLEDESRFRRADGIYRWCRSSILPVRDTNGRITGWYGLMTDIEDRKRAEEALRRNEAYLIEAQTLSHTGSFGRNLSTGEIYWSEETYKIFELDRSAKPTPQFVFERMHPDDRLHVHQSLDHAIHENMEFDVEHRLLLPDGSIKYLHVVARTMETSSGELEHVGAVTDITAAKLSELKFRESEAYLAEAQRISHTGSWAWNPTTGENRYWSDECFRLMGFDPAGGMPPFATVAQRFHPDDQPIFAEKLAVARRERAEFEVDYRIIHPGGVVRDICGIGHPVLGPSGELVEFVGSVIDVTERKQAEDKIRQSEMELRQLVDAIPQQVFVFSPDWNPLFANRQERDYTGLSSEEVRSKDAVARVIHPEDLKKLEDLRERGTLEASPFELEARIKGKDGQYRWFLIRDNPLLDDQGQIVRWCGTRTDITGRKQAEEIVRQNEIELRHILDFAPQHVAVLGPGRETLYLNHVLLDYFGRTLDDFLSLDRREFIEPGDWERLKTETQTNFLSGIPHEAEIRLRRKDGTYRWFVFNYSPLRDEQGRLRRWYVAGTDIEDRKQAEQRLQSENIALREEIDRALMFEEIVGTSSALRAVLSSVSKVAPTDSTVLITGETGTGKELIARAVHRRSHRSSRPFVSVNCAAIPRDLLASELFGHEKGAFTGAIQRRLGRFELAEGGTIFLDEIGELPAETQIALLRVLQEREFERVGGTRSIRTDVRVIAATNRDLQSAIAANTFRSDLLYRLNVFPIEVPSLRKRQEDIPLLVSYFIDRFARKAGKSFHSINKQSLELLWSYPWPGNIRELQNVIERSVVVCDTENFTVDESWLSVQPLASEPNGRPELGRPELSRKLADREKEMIEAALRETRGRVSGPSGAAIKLGIPGSTLDSKIRSLRIDKNRFKSPYPSTDHN